MTTSTMSDPVHLIHNNQPEEKRNGGGSNKDDEEEDCGGYRRMTGKAVPAPAKKRRL
jgi:hypothetical protein